MNVLVLGPKRERFENFFKSNGDNLNFYEGKINSNSSILNSIDFIISYGYRYIIEEDIINKFNNRIINLHISYLPWNRGADPNLWSFLEDTPKGVTIHYIDKGLDTGDIIAQKKIPIYTNDTLETTYNRLCQTVEKLLIEHWKNIITGNVNRIPQDKHSGSFHKIIDKERYTHLLTEGWKTPISNLIGKALY